MVTQTRWRIHGAGDGANRPPLETFWGGILSAAGAENATPKSANKVFERRRRDNFNKGTLGGQNAIP